MLTQIIIYSILTLVFTPLLVKLFARLWNEDNLFQRSWHVEMAKLYLKHGDSDGALTHLEKAEKLQKRFIRWC